MSADLYQHIWEARDTVFQGRGGLSHHYCCVFTGNFVCVFLLLFVKRINQVPLGYTSFCVFYGCIIKFSICMVQGIDTRWVKYFCLSPLTNHAENLPLSAISIFFVRKYLVFANKFKSWSLHGIIVAISAGPIVMYYVGMVQTYSYLLSPMMFFVGQLLKCLKKYGAFIE